MLNQCLLFLLAIIFGLAVSCGFIAFIVLIGIVPRLTAKTRTAQHIMLYEDMLVLGVAFGNIVSLYQLPLPFSYIGMAIMGLCFGIFTGCLAGALAEIVDIFPILSKRLHLRKGLPYVVTAMALGKGFGTIIQWFVLPDK